MASSASVMFKGRQAKWFAIRLVCLHAAVSRNEWKTFLRYLFPRPSLYGNRRYPGHRATPRCLRETRRVGARNYLEHLRNVSCRFRGFRSSLECSVPTSFKWTGINSFVVALATFLHLLVYLGWQSYSLTSISYSSSNGAGRWFLMHIQEMYASVGSLCSGFWHSSSLRSLQMRTLSCGCSLKFLALSNLTDRVDLNERIQLLGCSVADATTVEQIPCLPGF